MTDNKRAQPKAYAEHDKALFVFGVIGIKEFDGVFIVKNTARFVKRNAMFSDIDLFLLLIPLEPQPGHMYTVRKSDRVSTSPRVGPKALSYWFIWRRVRWTGRLTLREGSEAYKHVFAHKNDALRLENTPVALCKGGNESAELETEGIGNRPLEHDMIAEPVFFKQDPINNRFFKYYESTTVAATRQECLGLERAAVWEPEHVEDRLRDHYAGVTNKWVESLKP
jgi:hypothetical protein